MAYKKRSDRLAYCKKYNAEYYSHNKEKGRQRLKGRKRAITEYIRSKKTRCETCGETHHACLVFHHLDPNTKEIDIGNIKDHGWGITRIDKELEKCVVLCVNCHRKLHWGVE